MYQKTVLDNGVRIVTERIEHSRPVSIGIWVDVGSRDEHDLNNGSAHFVEHMFFKGTQKRSAQQIAIDLDMLGGMSNAFTANETTCFYGTVLDEQVTRLADIFCDIFLNSQFEQHEVDRERQVILQEINMVGDTPDDQIHELFSALLWGNHPLGFTVLGSPQVVGAMNSRQLSEYVRQYYTPDKVLIAASGNIEHQEFTELWASNFARLEKPGKERPARVKPAEGPPHQKIYTKPLEQVHMVLGAYGLPITSEYRYTLYLLNVLLGGNMSSRLFQEIREKRGLAYSIYSYLSSYIDSGYLGIYLGIDPAMVNEAITLIYEQIDALRHNRTTEQELANAKDYAKTGLYLASENMEARMTRLARNEISFGRYISIEEAAQGIDAVNTAKVMELAEMIFGRQDLSYAAIGPIQANDIDSKFFNR